VDVLIIPEVQRAIDALKVFRPRPGAWGAVIGHRRGSRFIVETITLAGSPGTVPSGQLLVGLDRIWPGRVIGLAAVRPGPAFKKALLGPVWYGKLVLILTGPSKASSFQPFLVEFEQKFFLDPVPLAPARKENARE